MDKLILKVQPRVLCGRKVKKLRDEGKLPANVFGKKVKSLAVAMDLASFIAIYKKAGETSLVTLVVEGAKGGNEEKAVLISNIQVNPVTNKPLHVDFHQVDLKEKVIAKVPVELTGESPAEKQGIGTVVTYISEIEVEALPGDLPEKFVVDATKLDAVDQAVILGDLDYDKKKVEMKIPTDTIVVKVEPPQKEEVIATAPVTAEAVGPEGAVKPEGETPAEGEAAKGQENKSPEEKK